MSGHSKWHSIKHKKGAADAKRGKIFTKHAKLIAIAARDGADPVMNPFLRNAIASARADNVPNANIEKAIKKGSGEDKEGVNLSEVMYEGFGPAGIAVYVQVITDNRNRALTNVKMIFNKNGGNLSEAGSVGWMFEKKGLILAKAVDKNPEEAELEAIDAGAQDITADGNDFEIITSAVELMKVRDNLEKAGFKIEKAELSYIPKNFIKIANIENARKVLKFVETLEDDEDVANVYSNFDIPEEIMEQI